MAATGRSRAVTERIPLLGRPGGPADRPGNALRLAGARDLDIATARQQVLQALADLDEARGLWLPSLFTGPTYYRARRAGPGDHGQVIQTVSRSSLFLGTTASLANSFPAAPPGVGLPAAEQPERGAADLRRDLRAEGRAARIIAANKAGVAVATNNALLAAPRRTSTSSGPPGHSPSRARPPATPRSWPDITGTFARSGAGLEADHRRMLTELRSRRRADPGRRRAAGGRLGQPGPPLVLDPHVVVAPVEPAETVIRLVPDDVPLDDLICQGWRSRPELAQARELVEAAVLRLKQAKLRPFVPSLAVTYSGGGFGGGQNAFFGNFNTRGDFAASLFWELQGPRPQRPWPPPSQCGGPATDGGHRPGPGPGPGRQRRGRVLQEPAPRPSDGDGRGPRVGHRGRPSRWG